MCARGHERTSGRERDRGWEGGREKSLVSRSTHAVKRAIKRDAAWSRPRPSPNLECRSCRRTSRRDCGYQPQVRDIIDCSLSLSAFLSRRAYASPLCKSSRKSARAGTRSSMKPPGNAWRDPPPIKMLLRRTPRCYSAENRLIENRSIDRYARKQESASEPTRRPKLYLGRMLSEREKTCLLHYRVAV